MLSENGPAREVGKGFRGPEGPASGAVSVNWSHQRTKQLTKEVWVPYTQRRVPGGFEYSRSAQMSVSLQGQDADLAVVETQEGCEVSYIRTEYDHLIYFMRAQTEVASKFEYFQIWLQEWQYALMISSQSKTLETQEVEILVSIEVNS